MRTSTFTSGVVSGQKYGYLFAFKDNNLKWQWSWQPPLPAYLTIGRENTLYIARDNELLAVRHDSEPPTSSPDPIPPFIRSPLSKLTGWAKDDFAGVHSVEVSVQRLSDGFYWNWECGKWENQENDEHWDRTDEGIFQKRMTLTNWSLSMPKTIWSNDTYVVRSMAQDWDTNVESPRPMIFTFDNEPPICSIKINNDALFTRSENVRLDLKFLDRGSGIDKVRYRNERGWSSWDKDRDWESPTKCKSWTLVRRKYDLEPILRTVYYQVMDRAGNLSSIESDNIYFLPIPMIIPENLKPGFLEQAGKQPGFLEYKKPEKPSLEQAEKQLGLWQAGKGGYENVKTRYPKLEWSLGEKLKPGEAFLVEIKGIRGTETENIEYRALTTFLSYKMPVMYPGLYKWRVSRVCAFSEITDKVRAPWRYFEVPNIWDPSDLSLVKVAIEALGPNLEIKFETVNKGGAVKGGLGGIYTIPVTACYTSTTRPKSRQIGGVLLAGTGSFEPGATAWKSIEWTPPSEENCEIHFCLDPGSMIPEGDENNERIESVVIRPDFSVSSDEIQYYEGVHVIQARVRNLGRTGVGESKVTFYIDGEPVDSHIKGTLAGGSCFAQILFELSPGHHLIRVKVDPDDEVDELSENNNELTTEITVAPPNKADLTVSPDEISYEESTIRAIIHNIGAADAGGFKLKFYVDGEATETLVGGLPAGESAVVLITRPLEPGYYSIRVILDVENQIDEFSEANNEATKLITV